MNRITPGPIRGIRGTGTSQVIAGSADPSAGAGVAAPEGSLYMRDTAGAGQVWYKFGAADTAWTQFGADSPVTAALLAELDFSAPLVQSFPESGLVLGQTPNSLYAFQEASGDIIDHVGAIDFTAQGAPLQGQGAIGLWDGSSYSARMATESTTNASSDYFRAPNTAAFDYDASTSFAWLIAFRSPGVSSAGRILRKFLSGVGYEIEVSAVSLTAVIDDGPNRVSLTQSAEFCDGAWHYALMVVNRTTNLLHLYTDLGSPIAVDISGVGSLSCAANVGFGGGATTLRAQWTYAVNWEAAEAEALSQAAADSWWQHAKDPTGLLTSTSRASLISVPVSSGCVAHFSGGTTLGTCQLPIGYHDAFSDAGKLGLWCNSSPTNMIQYSENFNTGNWGAISCPVTEDDSDAPDGFRSADLLAQIALNGHRRYLQGSGMTESTGYTFSVWLRADAPHTATIQITESSASGTAIATENVAVTSDWQLFSVTATTNVGQTTARCVIYPGEVGVGTSEEVHAWGAQLNLGTSRCAYIRTNGAAATLVPGKYSAAGDFVHLPKGEIDVTFVPVYSAGSTRVVVSSTGPADERLVYFSGGTGTNITSRIYNSAAAIEAAPSTTGGLLTIGAEHNLSLMWDSEDGVDAGQYEAVAILDGVQFNPDAFPWEGSPTPGYAAELAIGTRYSTASPADICVQRVRSWDGVVSL